MADRPLYAVKIGALWHIARLVPASQFDQAGPDVWEEDRTRKWIGRLGQEVRSIPLTEEAFP